MQSTDSKPAESAQQVASGTPTKEVKLAELKKLYDANLVTKEVYAEKQKAILDTQ
jgi:hypothetical protein